MTPTLDVRGDTTFVTFGDGRPDAMVQPDAYHPDRGLWSSWRRTTGNRFDAHHGWEWSADHPTREAALTAVGWVEGGPR